MSKGSTVVIYEVFLSLKLAIYHSTDLLVMPVESAINRRVWDSTGL